MNPTTNDYSRAAQLIDALETELKRLNRWSEPLLPAAYENMGAFGQNTMAFEQWIQFILLDRVRAIVSERGQFPDGSNIAAYAVRAFDGDNEADQIIQLLSQLDQLVDRINSEPVVQKHDDPTESSPTISLHDKLPDVVYTLIEVLPQFKGDDLESQLQTFDVFLNVCTPSVRKELSSLLLAASVETENETSKMRIAAAAQSVCEGGRAAAPYDHKASMRKFKEDHKRNFPQ